MTRVSRAENRAKCADEGKTYRKGSYKTIDGVRTKVRSGGCVAKRGTKTRVAGPLAPGMVYDRKTGEIRPRKTRKDKGSFRTEASEARFRRRAQVRALVMTKGHRKRSRSPTY